MRYKNTASTYWPRLIVEYSDAKKTDMGFLQISGSAQKIKIGRADGREFLLLLCLFSPRNFLSAKYDSVTQTHERVFSALGMRKGLLNRRLMAPVGGDEHISDVIDTSIRNLQKGDAGGHLTFTAQGDRLKMVVA